MLAAALPQSHLPALEPPDGLVPTSFCPVWYFLPVFGNVYRKSRPQFTRSDSAGQWKFSAKVLVSFAGMATLRDIAARTGVSISTASRALSNHEYVSDETRDRVLAAARELGYSPNAMARGLRRNQTRTIGLLIPEMRNTSSGAAAAYLQQHLQDFGYGLIVSMTRNDRETELRALEHMRAQQVAGIIHVPCSASSAYSLADGKPGIPVVEFFRRSGSEDVDSIVYDEVAAAEKVVDHLIQLGHKHIGLIVGPRRLRSTQERLKGAYHAVSKAGLGRDVLTAQHGDFSTETGRQSFSRLVQDSPRITAVFATSTHFVLGAAIALKESGLDVPGAISLAGFGDPEWLDLIHPPLTTYSLPLREMAMTAAQLMISRVEEEPGKYRLPTQITVSGNLILRASTAAPGTHTRP
jgi:LacI family transcriptional regulator